MRFIVPFVRGSEAVEVEVEAVTAIAASEAAELYAPPCEEGWLRAGPVVEADLSDEEVAS